MTNDTVAQQIRTALRARGQVSKENCIYLTWGGLDRDLGKLKDRKDLMAVLAEVYPKFKHFHRVQNSGQIWAFVHRMSPGDWVCVPSKRKTIHVGEITGQYTFVADQWCPRLIVSAKWAWASAGTYMHPAEPVGRPLAHGPLIQRRAGGGRRSDNPLAPPASLLVWRIFAKPLY